MKMIKVKRKAQYEHMLLSRSQRRYYNMQRR